MCLSVCLQWSLILFLMVYCLFVVFLVYHRPYLPDWESTSTLIIVFTQNSPVVYRFAHYFCTTVIVFIDLLQGFFIFVIHVLRSNEFRAAYLRKKQKWQTRNSSFPNSRSAGDASSVFSEGHGMSTVQGTTGSPDPLFRRHQVSPMSSDITKTRESCLTPVAID